MNMNISKTIENIASLKVQSQKAEDSKHIQSYSGFGKSGKNDMVRDNAGKKAENAAVRNNISGNNEKKLSEKAQALLERLRKQYGDYEFLIGNGQDELQTLANGGGKEFSVIFSSAEIERMANDEKYAGEKLQAVEGAVAMAKKICEEEGYGLKLGSTDVADSDAANGTVNKISIAIDDNGNMKFFAELEKVSDQLRERIEKTKEKRADEKKAEAKEAEVKFPKRNPYEKKENGVKRTTVEATSLEELAAKIKEIDWNSIKTSASGDRINFMA